MPLSAQAALSPSRLLLPFPISSSRKGAQYSASVLAHEVPLAGQGDGADGDPALGVLEFRLSGEPRKGIYIINGTKILR